MVLAGDVVLRLRTAGAAAGNVKRERLLGCVCILMRCQSTLTLEA